MKRRVWIKRKDRVKQRYWVGRRMRKHFGSQPQKKKGVLVLIRGGDPGEFIIVDSEKLKRDKKRVTWTEAYRKVHKVKKK